MEKVNSWLTIGIGALFTLEGLDEGAAVSYNGAE